MEAMTRQERVEDFAKECGEALSEAEGLGDAVRAAVEKLVEELIDEPITRLIDQEEELIPDDDEEDEGDPLCAETRAKAQSLVEKLRDVRDSSSEAASN